MEPVLNTAPTSTGLQLLRLRVSHITLLHPGGSGDARVCEHVGEARSTLGTVEASALCVSCDQTAAVSSSNFFSQHSATSVCEEPWPDHLLGYAPSVMQLPVSVQCRPFYRLSD